MSCGDKRGADLPGVTYQTGRMRVPVFRLISMLLVGYASRSHDGKSDPDVACEDPIPLVLFGFPRDYRDYVSKCVGVEQVDSELFADRCMRIRTVALHHLPGGGLSDWVYVSENQFTIEYLLVIKRCEFAAKG